MDSDSILSVMYGILYILYIVASGECLSIGSVVQAGPNILKKRADVSYFLSSVYICAVSLLVLRMSRAVP